MLKGGIDIKKGKILKTLIAVPLLLTALLYGGEYIAQFIGNYSLWKQTNSLGDGTSPLMPSANPLDCFHSVFRMPYGIYGLIVCLLLFILLFVLIMKLGHGDKGEYDNDRKVIFSKLGTYGTAGFMSEKETEGVLDLVTNIRKHSGTILGELDGKVVCVPEDTRMNANLAVYGASGSKKTSMACSRAFNCDIFSRRFSKRFSSFSVMEVCPFRLCPSTKTPSCPIYSYRAKNVTANAVFLRLLFGEPCLPKTLKLFVLLSNFEPRKNPEGRTYTLTLSTCAAA